MSRGSSRTFTAWAVRSVSLDRYEKKEVNSRRELEKKCFLQLLHGEFVLLRAMPPESVKKMLTDELHEGKLLQHE